MLSFRPPAVPLIVHDPYFSVWSFSDRLSDSWPKHWTGANNTSAGYLRVDGKAFRFCGWGPNEPAVEQQRVTVLPTRTIYDFSAGGVALKVTFLTPLLPDDLDVLSRPLTYVCFDVSSIDGAAHDVKVYFDAQSDWTVDSPGQAVVWGRHRMEKMDVMRIGSLAQNVLGRAGDNLRIDWGYLYLAVPNGQQAATVIADCTDARREFIRSGTLPTNDAMDFPKLANQGWPALAVAFDCSKVDSHTPAARHCMIAYDDLFGIEFLHQRLRPYWRRDGADAGELLLAAAADFPALARRCAEFDNEMMADLNEAGGQKYAALCALSYRQAIAAHKLVADADGTPLFFSKENFSNGCIATVDVTYPSAPLFLLVQPELLRGMLTPIFKYAMTRRWKFDFAPHDLGTYPLANGQVYGGGEKTDEDQMPVEECGNMLILAGALVQVDGNLDYIRPYWPLLSKWAAYLKDVGHDPSNQLCTDDFAGHMAHNINLSIKSILGLAAYAKIATQIGDAGAADYRAIAEAFASKWLTDADDGDHYRLAFDKSGTWSQKYNLIWDTLLDLNIFPKSVAEKEVAFYLKKNTKNGLPLDSRNTYTKLDWIVWTACLTGRREDFNELVGPAFDWANTTPTRVPLSDWYETADGKQVGFQARSVVGGLFIRLLQDPVIWEKWLNRRH